MNHSPHKSSQQGRRSQKEPSAVASLVVALFAAYISGRGNLNEARHQKTKGVVQERRTPDWMVIFTAASALGSLLAAIFAGWAAHENQNSVRETNRATRASVWLQVLADYETAEMLSSMNYLRQWQSRTPSFDKRFYELLTSSNPGTDDSELAKHLDSDRRRVIKFFDKLRILTQGDVIDSYFVTQNWDSGTYTYINDVLAPLHREKLQAMLDSKAITQEDFSNSSKVLSDILKFYHDTVVLKLPSPAGHK